MTSVGGCRRMAVVLWDSNTMIDMIEENQSQSRKYLNKRIMGNDVVV